LIRAVIFGEAYVQAMREAELVHWRPFEHVTGGSA